MTRYQVLVVVGGLWIYFTAFAQDASNQRAVQQQSHQRQVTLERLAPERRSSQQHAELAQTYYRSSRLEEAQSAANNALKAHPDNVDMMILLGDLHGRKKQWAIALTMFDRAAQLRPRQAEIALRQGQALMALGKVKQADFAFARYQALQRIEHRVP